MGSVLEKTIWCVNQRRTGMAGVLFLFPFLVVAAFLLLKIRWNGTYVDIIQEDTAIETVQFLAYCVASLLALSGGTSCLRQGHRLYGLTFLVLMLLFACVGMEEISWGQRIVGLPTPEFFMQHNAQAETTLHNLEPIQAKLHVLYILTGLLLSLGWIPARRLLTDSSPRAAAKGAVLLFTPRWYLMPFFLPTVLVYSYFCLSKAIVYLSGLDGLRVGGFVIWRDQEPAELLLSLGCLLSVAAAVIRQRSRSLAARAGESDASQGRSF